MKKKQTAIDSLIKRCNDSLDKELINPTQQKIGYSKALCHIIILLEEAKETEKKQIIDDYSEGFEAGYLLANGEDSKFEGREEYYNETYRNAN